MDSQMDSQFILNMLHSIKDIMLENKDYLIELDSVIGDGDLGLTMSDGFKAAAEAASAAGGEDIGKLLYTGGKAMASAVPSTMGTLMASGLMNAGKALKSETVLDLSKLALLFQAYADGVAARGKAQVGDKTFLDGIVPAVNALSRAAKKEESLSETAKSAADAAQIGYDNTLGMLARHGRAAARDEASRELKDPGAMVAVLLMKGLLKAVEE